VDTHQESIEPFDCLDLRADTVAVVVAHAHARVVVAHAQAVVVAHARGVVVVQGAAPGAPGRNCRESGSREILR